MKKLSLSLLSSFLVLILILLAGCASFAPSISPSTSTMTSISPSTSTSTTPPTSTVTTLPYELNSTLTISSVPKLGETVDFTFTVNVIRSDERNQPAAGLAHAKASLSFRWTNTKGSYSEAYSYVNVPRDEVIVSGDIPWEGSYSNGLTLHGKIKLPKEGIWSIGYHFIGKDWLAGAGGEIRVAVADGTAAIMGTEEFKNSPLAYLNNNSYAGGVRGPIVPSTMIPVTVGLDISKPPRAGEEVTLSCRINSVIDMPDVAIDWSFLRRLEDNIQEVPATELLSSADLGWKTDVKKGVPVVFSTKFKLPTEGDWDIAAVGKVGIKYLTSSGHHMRISITSTRSSYGWMEAPVNHTNSLEPTTTTIQPK